MCVCSRVWLLVYMSRVLAGAPRQVSASPCYGAKQWRKTYVYDFGRGTLWVLLYKQVGNFSWKGHRLLEKRTHTDQDPLHFHGLSPGTAREPARPGPPLGRPNLEARCYGFNVYTLACLLSFYLGVFKTQR